MLRGLKLKTIRPDHILFGYFFITFPEDTTLEVASRLLKHGISAKISNNTLLLPARLYKNIDSILSGIEYTKSKMLGLYGHIFAVRKRYGAMLAILLSGILFFFLNSLVWDVRIEGCEAGREDAIISELESAGLFVGARWRQIDKGIIEARLLADSSEVSWVNINRRGTVAYVKVIDKVEHDVELHPQGYANIVATRDAIIEEITVKRGVAMVKVGESVRKGQILISGVIPTEQGGGYCYAEGIVKGRFTDVISASVPPTVTEREYTDAKIGEFSLKIFSFSINILKIYGNSVESCDIIEGTKDFNVLGVRLPISAEYSELRRYAEHERRLTSAELTELAADELHKRLLDALSSSELVSVSTDGEFTDAGYEMRAHAVVRSDIGTAREFDFKME